MRQDAPARTHHGEVPESTLVRPDCHWPTSSQVAIEINGGAGQDPAYRDATAPFFLLAREMGARFTLTADAHHPDDFERLDIALDWAMAMGFREQDFLSPEEFRARQQSKVAAHFSAGVL